MSVHIFKINRGDSFEFTTFATDKNDHTQKYKLSDKDTFYFALCYPNTDFSNAIILKGCTADSIDEITGQPDQNPETLDITVRLTPNETQRLEPGVYYYTTKLFTGNTPGVLWDRSDAPKEVRTIIERTKFIVNE